MGLRLGRTVLIADLAHIGASIGRRHFLDLQRYPVVFLCDLNGWKVINKANWVLTSWKPPAMTGFPLKSHCTVGSGSPSISATNFTFSPEKAHDVLLSTKHGVSGPCRALMAFRPIRNCGDLVAPTGPVPNLPAPPWMAKMPGFPPITLPAAAKNNIVQSLPEEHTFEHKICNGAGSAHRVDGFTFVLGHILLAKPTNPKPSIALGVAKVHPIVLFDWLIVARPANCGLGFAGIFGTEFGISALLAKHRLDCIRKTWRLQNFANFLLIFNEIIRML